MYAASSRSTRKPAASISFGIGRSRWQPPVTALQSGVSAICQRRTPASGASPCSTNSSCPPGRSTRRISRSASAASGIVHSVHVVTTVSTLRSSTGIASDEASRKFTGTAAPRARRRAIATSRGAGSSAMTSLTRVP